MTFLEAITQHWSIILFVGGAVFNLGYTWATKDELKKKVKDLEDKAKTIDDKIELSNKDNSDLKGDIKAINTKLDLLLAGKIK